MPTAVLQRECDIELQRRGHPAVRNKQAGSLPHNEAVN